MVVIIDNAKWLLSSKKINGDYMITAFHSFVTVRNKHN